MTNWIKAWPVFLTLIVLFLFVLYWFVTILVIILPFLIVFCPIYLWWCVQQHRKRLLRAIKEAGPQGLPSGPPSDMDIRVYNAVIAALIKEQRIRQSNNVLYFIR